MVRTSVVRIIALLALALLGTSALAVLTATPAYAAARLSASSSLGGATAATSGATTFTVTGSGYQAIDGGFGGVYVGFGWVNGSGWGPSNGGATGRTYDYVPDEQSRSNNGYQAFVAFPGSSTAGEAQGTMGSDGSFRVSLTVPGPTFTGAGGKKIDCTKVTCGFLTWGAHGVRNGANESFTPVTFQGGTAPAAPAAEAAAGGAGVANAPAADAQAGRPAAAGRAAPRSRVSASAQGSPAPAAGSAGQQSGDAAGASGSDAETGGDSPADGAPLAVAGGISSTITALIEVDRKAARPGGAMGFAAAGFWPGEQVYVVLGDGDAAVGPVTAGVDGEVAGVLSLPEDIEPGTHEIRAAGAGSGLEAAERFPVRTDIAPAASTSGLRNSAGWIFLVLAALALLGAAAFLVHRRNPSAPEDTEELAEESLDGAGQEATTSTPFPHPAMTGPSDPSTTVLDTKDLR
ncbi:hypothetical protein [Rhodococcus sp. IEGM 1408]|uniref:hypothetical protein n=1 Tax=Rhodococcus sp. IEGM 1408 TaxID=3082220 RepID=UPI0029558055|nr:hypothetical protein [Rhodococcus sp. IEGM 1408]MDV8001041.1 hypothetical protein [Rhodococcus sp. IEGM 1408]